MIYGWYLLGGRGGEIAHQGLTDIHTYILFKLAQYCLTFFFGTDSHSGWPVKKTWARMLQDITNVSWDTDNITYILLAGSGMISPYIL